MNDTENKELNPAAKNTAESTEENRAPAAEAPIELTLDPAAAEAVASVPSAGETPAVAPAPEAPPAVEPAPEIPPAQAPAPEAPAAPAEPQPEPQPAPQQTPAPEPAPAPAWEKPTPQLTLDPDPELPVIEFNTEPPHAPEPPAEPQPPVQNQYYNYNAQNRSYSQPYAPGYQPPNYTAQSYRPRPQQQPMYTTPPIGYQQKSRLAAGLLAFVVGLFGVHNFYMGYNARGTIQLLLSLIGGILTCGLGTVASAIWAFIEAVMILSSTGPRFDGNGVIMKD